MRRKLNLILPHFVLWGIVALIILSTVYREPSAAISGIFLCIGIFFIIFASRIAFWWNESINEQRKSLASHFKIKNNSARMILYGWCTRFTESWAFRTYGFLVALLAAYHIYLQYSSAILGNGIDNKSINGIMINILIVFSLIRWWSIAKGTPYRRTIIKMGICWFIIVITYILSMSFNIKALALITIISFLAFIYYLIKAWNSERKYKKQYP